MFSKVREFSVSHIWYISKTHKNNRQVKIQSSKITLTRQETKKKKKKSKFPSRCPAQMSAMTTVNNIVPSSVRRALLPTTQPVFFPRETTIATSVTSAQNPPRLSLLYIFFSSSFRKSFTKDAGRESPRNNGAKQWRSAGNTGPSKYNSLRLLSLAFRCPR